MHKPTPTGPACSSRKLSNGENGGAVAVPVPLPPPETGWKSRCVSRKGGSPAPHSRARAQAPCPWPSVLPVAVCPAAARLPHVCGLVFSGNAVMQNRNTRRRAATTCRHWGCPPNSLCRPCLCLHPHCAEPGPPTAWRVPLCRHGRDSSTGSCGAVQMHRDRANECQRLSPRSPHSHSSEQCCR